MDHHQKLILYNFHKWWIPNPKTQKTWQHNNDLKKYIDIEKRTQ